MGDRERIQEVLVQLFNLATALHEKHYPENTHWTPSAGNMTELILQIDNMTSGLVRTPTELTQLKALNAELVGSLTKIAVGEETYGLQSREYKKIARDALAKHKAESEAQS